jgi:hypothetical protein
LVIFKTLPKVNNRPHRRKFAQSGHPELAMQLLFCNDLFSLLLLTEIGELSVPPRHVLVAHVVVVVDEQLLALSNRPETLANSLIRTDVKNIFAKKWAKILALWTQNKAKLCKKLIIALVFEKNDNFFSPKIVKIAENCDHNTDP